MNFEVVGESASADPGAGTPSWIISDSVGFFSALTKGVTFMLMVQQVIFIFFRLFYICRVFCKNTYTRIHTVFVKTTEPKRCLCLYRSVEYICFILLGYILLFVHFSGHY